MISLDLIKKNFFSALKHESFSLSELEIIFTAFTEELLGLSKVEILLSKQKMFPLEKANEYFKAIERLKDKEPYQYILGKTYFRDLVLKVNEHVLIPRPETEELVEKVNEKIRNCSNAIDLGTGSGCIAISLKQENPQLEVSAIDLCEKALEVAEENAELNHSEVRFSRGCISKPFNSEEKYDLMISNPPYIGLEEKSSLEPNVINWEPSKALFSVTEDPLYFYKEIKSRANESLNTNGLLALEIHENYGKETANVFNSEAFSNVEIFKDMQGKDRILVAYKN